MSGAVTRRARPLVIAHYAAHGLVGWSLYAAGRAFDRRVRVALLTLAALTCARLHVDHHRRTP